MRIPTTRNFIVALSASFLFFSTQATAQECALFKSEITDVRQFEDQVVQLTDSLKVYADQAAYAARLSQARGDSKKVQFLAGQALAAAMEAVEFAEEAHYHGRVCGIDAVVSYTTEASELSIDVRDLVEDSYNNAKLASTAGQLGDVHYYMRRSLNSAREANQLAQKVVYAAWDAHGSCTHTDSGYMGKGK
ncbi:hypothetical protein SAMN04490243_1034 [Robiginitalea myxolifaciens]|uniref:Uncharacterized protein n=1 Tax=Robiginitalea myxolifaciens TaxID=400055 RepID=A0A1I6G0K7_9FLAO|nr:hypothetical protein [Robiginitalea myxolifaciens]SFR35716.1 hypothetical protein SAMN04490243_1034 [Robiginitalea myxolifaciens]